LELIRYNIGMEKRSSWNKGIKTPDHVKEKISKAIKGRKLSDEHIKSMSLCRIGKKRNKFSQQARINMGAAHIGLKHSEETKRKIGEAHKGEKSVMWKGGVTDVYTRVRSSFEYRQWRSDVFTRDRFTCVHCQTKKSPFNADHIKPFALIVKENSIKNMDDARGCDELWNINNGRTLCVPCHKKTETYARNIK